MNTTAFAASYFLIVWVEHVESANVCRLHHDIHCFSISTQIVFVKFHEIPILRKSCHVTPKLSFHQSAAPGPPNFLANQQETMVFIHQNLGWTRTESQIKNAQLIAKLELFTKVKAQIKNSVFETSKIGKFLGSSKTENSPAQNILVNLACEKINSNIDVTQNSRPRNPSKNVGVPGVMMGGCPDFFRPFKFL